MTPEKGFICNKKEVIMKILKEFCILLICLMLGTITKSIINFPIPEAIYGMIYLFIALVVGILKTEDVETTTDYLSSILAFLFVPAGVNLMNEIGNIEAKDFVLIILVMLVTNILTMIVTGRVVQALQRRKNK